MGAGFVPTVLDTTLYKRVLRIRSEDAMTMTRRLATEEGLLVGKWQVSTEKSFQTENWISVV